MNNNQQNISDFESREFENEELIGMEIELEPEVEAALEKMWEQIEMENEMEGKQ